ncbi:class I SAM-dependent methyltransferase [Niastella populi]|uniref:Methyltransferase domain-containing protein n=1 Tax=Niastella populi TaxID=550983 RepID=A0A1V9EIS2_9BACT|nr:class I SAM-dependent methyltransferase [Niastella populi]OQP46029.1 hypothetical protein A4R26_32215 [Niastella populi]
MQKSTSGNGQYESLSEDMYKSYYEYSGKNDTIETIWSNAFGSNYPAGLNHFGFLTNTDLAMFMSLINAKRGDVLLDIGCGRGGPGLKIAEQKKLKLVGIDIVPEAIHEANLLKENFDLSYTAKFEVGGFGNIPMPDDSVDTVISIDAFWMVKNKEEALNEIKRVAKNGAQFLFTTWDILSDESSLMARQGFKVLSMLETENWKTYQMKVYDAILKHKDQLLKEMGRAANILISEAETVPPILEVTVRRFYHISVNK